MNAPDDPRRGGRRSLARPCPGAGLARGPTLRAARVRPASLLALLIVSLLAWSSLVPSWARTVPRYRGRNPLAGGWHFQTNGAPPDAWKRIDLPAAFEAHEGTNFNGVGWYRLEWVDRLIESGDRVLLQFDAAATDAEVWVNGRRVGSHLGGWTPFRFDITDALRFGEGVTNEIRVRLDEKVGHNTQGFLPIVQPHFGGLWQDVTYLRVRPTSIDDLRVRATGNPATECLELEVPLVGEKAALIDRLSVRWSVRGEARSQAGTLSLQPPAAPSPRGPRGDETIGRLRREGATLFAEIPIPRPKLWSPESPALYEVTIRLPDDGEAKGDTITTRAAFRSIQATGDRLLLNGRPLNVRGLLNWGYYPPRLAPHPDEARFRSDLVFARSRGFNLMKFCLWVPPRRYLEMCDEFGMLVWIEYPTWHPQLTPQFLEPLRREFTEFFEFDRNHPSVILRSLTCETGPGADLGVIRSLYDLAHRMIPGAVIEDDSSWIEWNRVSDIFDDHPYGNNHTWVKTLGRLRAYVADHGPKPLVLGEAIAADTWVPREPLVKALGDARPYWAPTVLDRQPAWLDRMRTLAGPDGLDRLTPDSLRYGWLMRKYQVEAFRREIPSGGYVISVIRDIPNASMGLIDALDRPKWTVEDWSWHGDTMCLLRTDDDTRSFEAGRRLRGDILVSHFGPEPIDKPWLTVAFSVPGATRPMVLRQTRLPVLPPGSLTPAAALDVELPETDRPLRGILTVSLGARRHQARNSWWLWVVPRAGDRPDPPIRLHPGAVSEKANGLFPDAPVAADADPSAIRVASRFDDGLVAFLEQGGRVLMVPDGGERSFRLSAHWFLRGAPYVPGHALSQRVPRDLLVELQHLDLAGDVIMDLPFLEEIDPILMLWDTHDHGTVKTHGLVFETRVGKGRLLVSALRHDGTHNAAGRWLAREFARHLAQDNAPRRALSPELWSALKAKLHEDAIPLSERAWRFKPDPRTEGIAQAWTSPTLDDSGWTDIKVGQHWESQGHAALDHWAWYRIRIDVPSRWEGRPVYLTFEGVDDCYELFVDGELVARRGDPVARRDTFNETFSHDLTARLKPGATHHLAVRVYDWYGAGGIFRPVTLSTAPHDPRTEVLK